MRQCTVLLFFWTDKLYPPAAQQPKTPAAAGNGLYCAKNCQFYAQYTNGKDFSSYFTHGRSDYIYIEEVICRGFATMANESGIIFSDQKIRKPDDA